MGRQCILWVSALDSHISVKPSPSQVQAGHFLVMDPTIISRPREVPCWGGLEGSSPGERTSHEPLGSPGSEKACAPPAPKLLLQGQEGDWDRGTLWEESFPE